MARLQESPLLIEAIRQKAYLNSRLNLKYGKKASFEDGRAVISFEEQCEIIRQLGLKSSKPA